MKEENTRRNPLEEDIELKLLSCVDTFCPAKRDSFLWFKHNQFDCITHVKQVFMLKITMTMRNVVIDKVLQ